MRRDLITYCPDISALIAEVELLDDSYVVYDDNNIATGLTISKHPVKYKSGGTSESLAIIRLTDKEYTLIQQLNSLTILADIPLGGDLLASMTTANKVIYDSVYTPQDILDESGNVVGTGAALFGGFAG